MGRSGRRAAAAVALAALAVVAVIFSVSETETIREDSEVVPIHGLAQRLFATTEAREEEVDPDEATKALAKNAQQALDGNKGKPTVQDIWAGKLSTMLKQSDEAHKRGRENMHKTLMKASQKAENLHQDEEEEDQLAQQLANAASSNIIVPKEPEPAAQVVVPAKDRDISGADAALLAVPDTPVEQISQQLDKATADMTSPDQMLTEVSPDHESKLKVAQNAANEAKAKYMSAFKEVKAKKEDKQLSAQKTKAMSMVSDPRHFDFSNERKMKAEKARRLAEVESAHKQAAAAQTALLSKKKHDELSNKDAQIRQDKANEKLAKAKLFKLSKSAISDVKEEEIEVPKEPAEEVPVQVTDSKVGLESVSDYVDKITEKGMEKARKIHEKKAADAAHKAEAKAAAAEEKLRVVNLEETTLKLKKKHAVVVQQKNKLQQQLMMERESHRQEVEKIQAKADADEKSHKKEQQSSSQHAATLQAQAFNAEQAEEKLKSQEANIRATAADTEHTLKYQLMGVQSDKQATEAELQETKRKMEAQKEKEQSIDTAKQQLQMEVETVKQQLENSKEDLENTKKGMEQKLAKEKEDMQYTEHDVQYRLEDSKNKVSAAKAKLAAMKQQLAESKSDLQDTKQGMQDQLKAGKDAVNDEVSAAKAKASAMKAKAQAMMEQAKEMEAHSKALLDQQKEEEAKAKRAMEKKLAAVKEAEASEATAVAKVKTEAEAVPAVDAKAQAKVDSMKAQLEALKQQLQAEQKQHHQDVKKLQAQKLEAARPVVAVAPAEPKVVVTHKEEPKVLQKAKQAAAEGEASRKLVDHAADANMAKDERQAQGAMDDLMRLAGSDDKASDSEVPVEEMLETSVPTNAEMADDEDLFDVDSLMNEAQAHAQVHA